LPLALANRGGQPAGGVQAPIPNQHRVRRDFREPFGKLLDSPEKFFFPSLWTKALTATLVLCLPVFFAGIVFIRSFARDGFRGEALGSNLFGAMIGGILESASLPTGIRFLLVIAALLYLASWIALHLERPLDEVACNPAKAQSESLVETA
jgi:hypothetical protein